MEFPVDNIAPALQKSLKAGVKNFVVAAPTGSGKSTRLPVMLMNSGCANGKIIVMQPRRVAARMLAKGVGRLFDMENDVGWHVRFDKHYTPDTKIIFLTEGILARMILSDPQLKGVGAIVFDEFHQRNIYADISLALAIRTQKELRPDLIIAACSASMDSCALAKYLNAEVLECAGRMFPIDTRYSPVKMGEQVWDCAAKEFEYLSREFDEGNFLIFMAGAYEISRTISRLLESPSARGFDVFALYGDLPPAQQDKILSPSQKRKIIVSTNVAETSLTIEGVKFVIDAGQARVARFDAARGVNTLLVERISLASATQRAGRAGRTSAGVAVRLWRSKDEENFERYTASEISRLDLSQILLWLKSANLEFEKLPMFEFPPSENFERAKKTLHDLGALDSNGKITSIGKLMSDFPAQPRFARLMIEGIRRNCLEEVCIIAALTEVGRLKLPIENAFAEAKRDELVGDANSELEELIALCRLARENSFKDSFCREFGIHGSNARRVCQLADEFVRMACSRRTENFLRDLNCENFDEKNPDIESKSVRLAKCILSAFSDHLCARLNQGTFACRVIGGRRGEIRKQSRVWAKDIFVALNLSEQNVSGGVNIVASMIAPIEISQIEEIFPDEFSDATSTFFDEKQKRVVCRRTVSFRDLELTDSSAGNPDPSLSAKILRDEILAGRLALKNFDDDAQAFIDRVNFVFSKCPQSGIAPIDEPAKSEIFEQMCCGCFSYSDVKNLDVHQALRDWLSAHQQGLLNYLAPRTVEFANRKRPVYIRYELSTGRAVVASLFKDFYDFDSRKIKICDGAVAPTFEILAPNGRPIQTTQNLEEFFKTSWLEIKKELRARYPKHFKNEPRD